MSREKWVMGNWKMNGSNASIQALLASIIAEYPRGLDASCVVFPPSIYLAMVSKELQSTPIQWGAQNVHCKQAGAYTGELSCTMLREFDCRYVLIGHSERRRGLHEDEKFIAEKYHQSKEHGIIPVLCVGETRRERDDGLMRDVIARQIRSVFSESQNDFKSCVIAYEPVWAIGTGLHAGAEEAQEAHAFIREVVAEKNKHDAHAVSIIYGGSVNESNAKALFSQPDIDGGLVGGASLNARQFLEILKCIK